MRIVRPKTINATTGLVSNSVAETVAAYDGAHAYAAGDVVYSLVDGLHQTFTSAQAANTGHPVSDPTWWTPGQVTNAHAMLDGKVQTQTTAENQIVVVVSPGGRVDTLALLNVDAASVRVQMHDQDDVLLSDQTYSLVSPSGILRLFDYLFEPIVRKNDLIVRGLRLLLNPKITVTISNPGETAGVGALLVGFSKEIGKTRWGARVGITDNSIKQADTFGDFVVVERSFSKRGSFELLVQPGFVDELQTMLAKYRATPILYIGNDKYSSTAIYGFYKDFEQQIAYENQTLCTVEIEGLS